MKPLTEDFINRHLMFESVENAQAALDKEYPGYTVEIDELGDCHVYDENKIRVNSIVRHGHSIRRIK